MLDPRTPVIAGAFQRTYREDPPQPVAMMDQVAREAAGPLLDKVASLAVVESFSWPVEDPGTPLAQRLGVAPRETVRSARGGNGPLALIGDAAERIAAGELDVALVVGAEAMTPYMRAVKAGEQTGWTPHDGAPSRVVGRDRDASHPAETAAGLIAPIFYYPLIEHAHRAAAGRTVEEHTRWIASWWSRFSDVAADNEHAWSQTKLTPEEIGTASERNRLVSSPYTKVMNANIQVDQAAAVLVCSAEAATRAGLRDDELTFITGSANGEDHWFVGARERLDRSPALTDVFHAIAGAQADHVDLYSCFPSAVQTAAHELGLDLETATPTVTGGLAFFGGPANNYALHSVVSLVDTLREEPGTALATAVGWYLTKHHALKLGSAPEAFSSHAYEPDTPRMAIGQGASVDSVVESYTALYDRDGVATMGIVSARSGRTRVFGKSHDLDVVAELLDTDPIGRDVRIDDAEFRLS